MTTYTATIEQTSFLPVRQYEVSALDSLMRVIRVEKRNALYDLTVTLSKIERDDEMPIKGEIVDEVQFSINKNNSASQAEINKLNTEVAYRDRKIEQLERQVRGLKGEFDEAKEQIRQLKEANEKRLTCDFVRTAQKKAVKEFAEKLKGKLQDFGDGGEKGAYITEKDIDELLKGYER